MISRSGSSVALVAASLAIGGCNSLPENASPNSDSTDLKTETITSNRDFEKSTIQLSDGSTVMFVSEHPLHQETLWNTGSGYEKRTRDGLDHYFIDLNGVVRNDKGEFVKVKDTFTGDIKDTPSYRHLVKDLCLPPHSYLRVSNPAPGLWDITVKRY